MPPGREGRVGEVAADEVNELAARACVHLLRTLSAPYALVGHSMGALVAIELAAALVRAGAPTPRLLVLVAPPFAPTDQDWTQVDDVALVERLVSLGGTAPEVLRSPELVGLVAAAVRHDVGAVRRYRAPHRVAAERVVVLVGANDPLANPQQAFDWAARCVPAPEVRVLEGGHFLLDEADHRRMLTEIVLTDHATEHTDVRGARA